MLKSLFILSILLFNSCATKTPQNLDDTLTMEKLVSGWAEMVNDLQGYSTKIQELQDKRYRLKVTLEGDWNLAVTPRNAFLIEKGKLGLFYVSVVNPYLLFENLGGISKMTYVQAELSKAGGEQGAIDLSGETACLYQVSFFQKNGALVNFDKLSTAYDFDFLIDPPRELEIYQMLPTSVIFKRSTESNEESQVQIRLISKNKNEVYLGQVVRIPACHQSAASRPTATLEVTPGQCVRHYQTLGAPLETDKRLDHEMEEVFGNLCERTIQCFMPARFGLIKAGKIVSAKDKKISFVIPPKTHQKINVSWSHESREHDSKIYLGSYFTKEAMLPGVEINQFQQLQCEWTEEF